MGAVAEQIFADLKAAMKAREKERVGVLRMVRADLQNAQIAAGHDLSDDEAASQYRSGGEEGRAAAEEAEIEVIEPYLPAQLSEVEVVALIDAALADLPEAERTNLGKVMKAVMPKVAGRADGKQVNALVRQRLA